MYSKQIVLLFLDNTWATAQSTSNLTTSYPGSFLYAKTRRKDPGRGWSRGSQILGAELKIHLGRGGRRARVSCLKMLRLKLINLCVFAIVFAT